MMLWDLLTEVSHNWFACSLFCLFMGGAMGLMLADSYHTVRCDSKVHNRTWWKELLGWYDK